MGLNIHSTCFDVSGNIVEFPGSEGIFEWPVFYALLGAKSCCLVEPYSKIPREEIVLPEGLKYDIGFPRERQDTTGLPPSAEIIQVCARKIPHLTCDDLPYWVYMKSLENFDWDVVVSSAMEGEDPGPLNEFVPDEFFAAIKKASELDVVGILYTLSY